MSIQSRIDKRECEYIKDGRGTCIERSYTSYCDKCKENHEARKIQEIVIHGEIKILNKLIESEKGTRYYPIISNKAQAGIDVLKKICECSECSKN